MIGFSAASGKGFDSAIKMKSGNGVSFCIGVWSCNESDESLNWREFTNTVEALKREGRAGRIPITVRPISSLSILQLSWHCTRARLQPGSCWLW
jgi:hypothetical protein